MCSWSVSRPIWFACVCRMWWPAAKWWVWQQWPFDTAPFRSIFVDKNQIQYLMCTERRKPHSTQTTRLIKWSLCYFDWTMMVSPAAYTVSSSFRTLSAAIEEKNVKHARIYYYFLNRKFQHATTLARRTTASRKWNGMWTKNGSKLFHDAKWSEI